MKSATERSREFRQRQKAAKLAPGDELAGRYAEPFFQFYNQAADASQFLLPLRLANIDPPAFDDDRPAIYPPDLEGLDLPSAPNSIARAELIVGCLLDAAAALASIINDYKRQQISKRLEKITMASFRNVDEKRRIMTEVKKLATMDKQLEKQVRWSLRQWKVVDD